VAARLRALRDDDVGTVLLQPDRFLHDGRRAHHDGAGCLDALLADAAAGRAYFKVYRQFKMYNDPRFNPVLVAERAERTREQQGRTG
jgi:hypothetical protein